MRSRNIKPGFFANADLIELGPLTHLLFAGLWCIADREGRFEDRPNQIKINIAPGYDCDINGILKGLESRGFIIRYESGGKHYVQIVNFKKHQNPHVNETTSTVPAPELHQSSTGVIRLIPDSGFLIPDSLIPDSKDLKTPRKRRAADGDGRIRPLIDKFFQSLKSKLGEKPVFNGGAAARGLAVLLRTFSPAEIERRMQFWFDTKDAFVAKRAWRAEDFVSNFNGLKNGPLLGGYNANGRERHGENRTPRYRESDEKYKGVGRLDDTPDLERKSDLEPNAGTGSSESVPAE